MGIETLVSFSVGTLIQHSISLHSSLVSNKVLFPDTSVLPAEDDDDVVDADDVDYDYDE